MLVGSIRSQKMRMCCLLLLLLSAYGCAFKRLSAPESELSAQKQRVFARAVDSAIGRLKCGVISSGRVFVHFNPIEPSEGHRVAQEVLPGASTLPIGGGVVTIQPQLPQEENYIAERIREKLARDGIILTDNREDADFVIHTLLFSSGTETTMRELSYTITFFVKIVIFYSEELEHSLHLLIVAYDKENRRFVNLLDGRTVAKDIEIFLMKVYGPTISTVRHLSN